MSNKERDDTNPCLQLTLYEIHHLAEHLIQAGHVEELHLLLRLETRSKKNAWFEAKTILGNTAGYLEDLRLASRCAEQRSRQSYPPDAIAIGLQFRYALIRSSLNSLAVALAPSLVVGLVQQNLWTLDQAYANACQVPDNAKRAGILGAILTLLPTHSQEAVLQEALASARSVVDAEERARVLNEIAMRLPENRCGEIYTEVLETVRSVASDYFRAKLLINLAHHCGADFWPRVWMVAQDIRDVDVRAATLCDLFSRVTSSRRDSVWPEVSSAIRSLYCSKHSSRHYAAEKVRAVSLCLPNAPESERPRLLEVVFRTAQKSRPRQAPNIVQTLCSLAAFGCESDRMRVLQKALELAKRPKQSTFRSAALPLVLKALPVSERAPVLATAQAMVRALGRKEDRARGLCRLVPGATDKERQAVWEEALSAVATIGKAETRFMILAELIPQLHSADISAVLDAGLEAARSISNARVRCSAFLELAPYLSRRDRAEVLRDALRASWTVADNDAQAEVLCGFASGVPEPRRRASIRDGIRAIRAARSAECKWRALQTLLPAVGQLLPTEGIKAARTIREITFRAKALCDLAVVMPDPEYSILWQEAYQLPKDKFVWAEVRDYLAPHAPAIMRHRIWKLALTIWNWRRHDIQAVVLQKFAADIPEAERAAIWRNAFVGKDRDKDDLHFNWHNDGDNVVGDAANCWLHLVKNAPPSLWKEAVDMARRRHDRYFGDMAMIELVRQAPADLQMDALEAAHSISDSRIRSESLLILAPRIPSPERECVFREALFVARKVWDAAARAKIMARLIVYLPEDEGLEHEVLELAMSVETLDAQAEILWEILPYLPAQSQRHATRELRKIAKSLSTPGNCLRAFCRVVRFTPPAELSPLLPELLNAISVAKADKTLPESIRDLTMNGSDSEGMLPLRDVLAATSSLADESARSNLLVALAPTLHGDLRFIALASAWTLRDGVSQMKALSALTSQAPSEFVSSAQDLSWASSLDLAVEGWSVLTQHLASLSRADTFKRLHEISPLASSVGGAKLTMFVFEAVQDVTRWWP